MKFIESTTREMWFLSSSVGLMVGRHRLASRLILGLGGVLAVLYLNSQFPLLSFTDLTALLWTHSLLNATLFLVTALALFSIGQILRWARSQTTHVAQESENHKKWFQIALSSIGDAVIATDENNRIVFINPMGETLTGYAQDEALGQPLEAVFAIANSEGLSQTILTNSTMLTCRDRQRIAIEQSSSPIRDQSGVVRGMVVVFRDVSEKIRTENNLRVSTQMTEDSLEKLQAVVENLNEGLLIVNPQGHILFMNPVALRVHQFETFEEMFKRVDLYPEIFTLSTSEGNELKFEEWPISRMMRGERFFDHEVSVTRRDKNKTWIGSYSGTPIFNKHTQEFMLGVLLVRDVTAKKKAELDLKDAIQMRDELMSICSHELRTPVASMKLATQMYKRGLQKNDAQLTSMDRVRLMVDQADLQLDRLTRLIDEMLDFTRIAGGRLQLTFKRFNLRDLVCESLDRIRPQFEAAGIEVQIDATEDIWGLWDSFRMEQVFTNLFTNALKYGAHKPVQVRVKQIDEMVHVTIQDQGLGISAEDCVRIFQPYERAVSVHNISGLGLGLYISDQIVKAHHGQIEVKSQQGKGSTFNVIIPKYLDQSGQAVFYHAK